MNDDTPIPLAEACRIAFNGAIGPDTLRAEARRGRLVIERIGRRDFVTLAAIREMRRLCQLQPKDRASGSRRDDSELTGRSPGVNGASGMTGNTSAAFLTGLETVRQLKKH